MESVFGTFLIGIGLGIILGTPSCYYFFKGITKKHSWGGKLGTEKLIVLNSVGVGFSNILFTFLINDTAGRDMFGIILRDASNKWYFLLGLTTVFFFFHCISWIILGKIFLPFDIKGLIIFSIKTFFLTYIFLIGVIIFIGGGYILF